MSITSRAVPPFRVVPELPGDKSITHRAYLMAALARGRTEVLYPNRGADCEATLRAVASLGTRVKVQDDGATLITGHHGMFRVPSAPIDLGNSGTSLRLMLGLLAAQPFSTVLTGDSSLQRRPVERVLEPLRRMGAQAEAPGDHPPVLITGTRLQGVRHRLAVPSAQVKSALLLAGAQAEGTTVVEGAGGSRDHTERLLRLFDVEVKGEGDWIEIEGPAPLTGSVVAVPGDPSAAAFYLAAALVVPGSEVLLEGVSLNPTRINGFHALESMGLEVTVVEDDDAGAEPMGNVLAVSHGSSGVEIGPGEIPGLVDELPAIAVAAAFAEGTTRVRGAGELRVKESDRLAAVGEGLAAIGASVTLLEDGWEIDGTAGGRLPGGKVRSHGDHRVAMAFLVAGLGCRDGVEIVDEPGIGTSDPHFLTNLKAILEGTS